MTKRAVVAAILLITLMTYVNTTGYALGSADRSTETVSGRTDGPPSFPPSLPPLP